MCHSMIYIKILVASRINGFMNLSKYSRGIEWLLQLVSSPFHGHRVIMFSSLLLYMSEALIIYSEHDNI